MASDLAIHTYGGGEALHYVFQGIATILSGDTLGNLLTIAGSLGILWASIITVLKGTISEGGKWFLWFMITLNVFLLPKTTVWIIDEIGGRQAYKVDNVPLLLGKTASIISSIGDGLTKKMEQNFSVVDDLKYHKTGTVFASKVAALSSHFQIIDADFNENMSKFVNSCVVYTAMIGYKYTVKDLRESNDIWQLVSDNAPKALGMNYRYPRAGATDSGDTNSSEPEIEPKESEILTCKQVAGLLAEQWKHQVKLASRKYGKQAMSNISEDLKRDFGSRLGGTFEYLTGIAKGADDILRQQMMINVIESASHNKVNELGGTTNYASAKALLQQRSSYQTTGELAARLLPAMKVVFEALAYGAFIIVAMLVIFPQGWKVLTSYLGILMWIQMWAPLYAVLNLLMNVYAKSETQSYLGNEEITMMTSIGVSGINAEIQALAGYLSMSIPFISYAIVKGGAASFMHLAGHLGSAIQASASSAASEVTSGNISLGNFSQGTMAYQNANAFQHNSSANHTSGQVRSNTDHGEIVTTQADGSTVITGGAGHTISTGATSVSSGKLLSKQLNQDLSKSESVLASSSKEVASAESQAIRESIELGARILDGKSSGETYSMTDSTGERTSFAKSIDLAESLQQKHGWNSRQSSEAAFSVVVGGGVMLKAEGKTSFSSLADRTQALEQAKDMSSKEGFSENIESVMNSAKDTRFGTNQSEEKSLSESLSGSVEKMHSAREQQSIAKQDVDTYREAISYVESDSFNANHNYDQEFLSK
jgi:conjugal transfer mating pair stabilization protein TraG